MIRLAVPHAEFTVKHGYFCSVWVSPDFKQAMPAEVLEGRPIWVLEPYVEDIQPVVGALVWCGVTGETVRYSYEINRYRRNAIVRKMHGEGLHNVIF